MTSSPQSQQTVELQACLPANMQNSSTRITPIAAGLSGAGVYRVEADGETFVLKISDPDEALTAWRSKFEIQQNAAKAGLAPQIIHSDENRHAVLSAFIADKSFPMAYGNPQTREAAVTLLGQMLRRLHALPPVAEEKNPKDFIAKLWSELSDFRLPAFVGEAVQNILAEEAPDSGRNKVLSHNDLNPTNLVYDGQNLLLLDWETTALNDPYYDPGAIDLFLRMDEATCLKLLSAYESQPVLELPARFNYSRRLAGMMCGTAFLHLASQGGHSGAQGNETLESTATLADFYQRLRSGAFGIATPLGQWLFGLALIKESLTI